jgi:hypothetical protein
MGTMRYMNIGFVVSVAIIVGGVVAFREHESAMQAVALVGMLAGLAVGLWLDARAARRGGKRTQ